MSIESIFEAIENDETAASSTEDQSNEQTESVENAENETNENTDQNSVEEDSDASSDSNNDSQEDEDTEAEEGDSTSSSAEDDLVEVDGKKFFYHSKTHAENSGQANNFETRDKAEDALLNKITFIKEKLAPFSKGEKDLGIIESLPPYLKNDLSINEDAAEFERILDLDAEGLRKELAESDRLITHLKNIEKAEEEQSASTENVEPPEQLKQELNQTQQNLLKVFNSFKVNVEEVAKVKDADIESYFKSQANSYANAQSKAKAKELRELNPDDFETDAEYTKAYDALFEEVLSLKDKASKEYLDNVYGEVQKYVDVSKRLREASTNTKATNSQERAQMIEKQKLAFHSFQEKLPGDTSKVDASHFYEWASKKAASSGKYNTSVYAWNEARKEYLAEMEQLRAQKRAAHDAKKNTKTEKKPKTPKYSEEFTKNKIESSEDIFNSMGL